MCQFSLLFLFIDTPLVLVGTPTQSQIQLTMPTPANNPPSFYFVEYADVVTTNEITTTIPVGVTSTSFTLSNLDDISQSNPQQRGRLIEVTLRAEDANGAILAGPACYRTCKLKLLLSA